MNEDIKNKFYALQNYEVAVSADDWEIISSRLQQRKRRKLIVACFSAGAVAASVALFFFLHYPAPTEELPTSLTSLTANTIDTSEAADIQVQITTLDTVAKLQSTTATHIAKHSPTQQTSSLHTILPTIVDTIPTEATIQIAAVDPIKTTTDSTIVVAEVIPTTLDSLFVFPLFNEPLSDRNKNTQTWAVAFLTGPSTGLNTSSEGKDKFAIRNPNLSIVWDVVDTRHHLPLSAGITFRFYFAPRWAVESGLVYTYLASDYSLSNQAKIKQRLHYLGMPVNLVWQFIESKGFYFYVSGGCMLEKGLAANYSYIGFSGESTRSESIAGLQWSLNGQVGVGYNFYKQFGLYFEPGLRWFLSNNSQPESVRTERPLSFVLNAGLRLNF